VSKRRRPGNGCGQVVIVNAKEYLIILLSSLNVWKKRKRRTSQIAIKKQFIPSEWKDHILPEPRA
jgi:hypothetical protein